MLTVQYILIFIFISVITSKYLLQRKKIANDKNYLSKILNHNLKICMLAQVQGMNLILKEGAKTELQKELFLSLSNSCKYNLDIITTLLDVFKVENNEQYFEPEIFDIRTLNLIHNETITELLKEKHIKIVNNYQNLQNYKIYANKTFIQKLITNLVYMALVYSFKHTETIISYNPLGKKLKFNILYQGHVPYNTNYTFSDYMSIGCGIKMYYCKKIAEFYGGCFNLSSTFNNHISIHFVLPIVQQRSECILKVISKK